MQLDRVRRHPGLAVREIEKGDAGDTRSSAQPDVATCDTHLTAPKRCRMPVTARRRRLGDHVIAALLEDDVEVAVCLRPDEHDPRNDGKDLMLERQTRVRQVRGRQPRAEEANRRLTGRQQAGPILERLYRPPIAATGCV